MSGNHHISRTICVGDSQDKGSLIRKTFWESEEANLLSPCESSRLVLWLSSSVLLAKSSLVQNAKKKHFLEVIMFKV